MTDIKIQAGGLLKLIRARYQTPEWAVLDELHDGTGSTATRRFDAVAFNCWPAAIEAMAPVPPGPLDG